MRPDSWSTWEATGGMSGLRRTCLLNGGNATSGETCPPFGRTCHPTGRNTTRHNPGAMRQRFFLASIVSVCQTTGNRVLSASSAGITARRPASPHGSRGGACGAANRSCDCIALRVRVAPQTGAIIVSTRVVVWVCHGPGTTETRCSHTSHVGITATSSCRRRGRCACLRVRTAPGRRGGASNGEAWPRQAEASPGRVQRL